MNLSLYYRANRYAGKLKYIDSTDLVHDCYLMWYDKTGKNLFEEPEPKVYTVIRLSFMDYLRRRQWSKDKVYQGARIFESFNEEVNPLVDKTTPQDSYEAVELLQKYNELVINAPYSKYGNKDSLKLILERRLQGFNNKEIAQEMGISKSMVTFFLNQTDINKLRMREYEPHNPFNSSLVKVYKTLKRNEYDKNIDKYKDFKFDTDLGADSNEHYMLLVNDNKEGLLIRENFKRDVNVFKNR